MNDDNKKFREDILALTASQNEKIDKLASIVCGNTKSIGDLLVEVVKQSKQPAPVEQQNVVEEKTYIIFTTSTEPITIMSKEEFTVKTQEVIKLVKPILVKYGIAQLNAFLVDKKV